MRTRIFTIFLLTLFCLASCSKEDQFNLDSIVGTWTNNTGDEDPDGVGHRKEFYFRDNHTCMLYDNYSDAPPFWEGTYFVTFIGNTRVLTIYDKDKEVAEQYYILRLEGDEMRLEHAGEYTGEPGINMWRIRMMQFNE